MKMTDIRMEWTDTGAIVSLKTSKPDFIVSCPRCGTIVKTGYTHRCGDQASAPTKPVATKKKRAKARGESR